jgi:two-component system sensor histidine kinase KdpD
MASLRHRLRHLRHLLELRVTAYTVAAALPICVIAISMQIGLPDFVFEHLMVLLVVVSAVGGGRGPAVVAAVSGSVADNLFFSEPVGRPAITGVRDVVDLGLFVSVALIVGWLVNGLRVAKTRAIEAAEGERRAREERDRLIATVTHDLAAPLGVIQGSVQRVRAHAAVSAADIMRQLARVETAAARVTSLLRTLADTRSIREGSLSMESRPLDFRSIVEPGARMFDGMSDRHPLALAMDSTPVVIAGDAERLGRLVENLVTNAIKYSPDGGAVEITVGKDRASAVLRVRDHGIGISADASQRPFELGYRAPVAETIAPGLGLGLYIAAEVVRRHGGTLTATPAEGSGTLFTVRLPLASHTQLALQADLVRDVAVSSSSRAVH